MKKILVILSLIVVLALMFTKGVNMQNMIITGDDGSSYADISAVIYILAGISLIYIAWRTIGRNFLNPLGILPYGIGISSLIYGLFLCSVKGII